MREILVLIGPYDTRVNIRVDDASNSGLQENSGRQGPVESVVYFSENFFFRPYFVLIGDR